MPIPSSSTLPLRLERAVRDVSDFPKAGIVFKDITPALALGELFAELTLAMADPFRDLGITQVAGIESRGFILAGPVAQHLRAGFIPVRKPGKLPWRTATKEYSLEYGTDRLEMHVDSCPARARVLVVDDVLATGGTAAAACELIEGIGGVVVGCAFLLEIAALGGAARLRGRRISSLLAT